MEETNFSLNGQKKVLWLIGVCVGAFKEYNKAREACRTWNLNKQLYNKEIWLKVWKMTKINAFKIKQEVGD